MSTREVIIVGATGMVGGAALRICLERDSVSQVTSIGRQPTGVTHSKLLEIRHDNFIDYAAIREVFANQDLALFCIGVYSGTVPDEEFRRITVDYPAIFAEALHQSSPKATFCFLSGQGADQTEKSRLAFARYKGRAEKALSQVGFPRLNIFRPGYIYPVIPRKEPNLTYRVSRMLFPLLSRLYPNLGVTSESLAQAMVQVGLDDKSPTAIRLLENRDIRQMQER